jgi:hypothetical protein
MDNVDPTITLCITDNRQISILKAALPDMLQLDPRRTKLRNDMDDPTVQNERMLTALLNRAVDLTDTEDPSVANCKADAPLLNRAVERTDNEDPMQSSWNVLHKCPIFTEDRMDTLEPRLRVSMILALPLILAPPTADTALPIRA